MIVPATESILRRFWNGSIPRTMTAFAVIHDGEPVTVAGFYFDRYRRVAFVEGAHNITKRERVELKRKWIAALDDSPLPIHAGADPEIAGSEALLKHLGFEPASQGVWVWDGP